MVAVAAGLAGVWHRGAGRPCCAACSLTRRDTQGGRERAEQPGVRAFLERLQSTQVRPARNARSMRDIPADAAACAHAQPPTPGALRHRVL